MNMKTVQIAFAALLLISGPALAGDGQHDSHAGMRGHGGGLMPMQGEPDPERMVRHISRWLSLDETQTQELSNVVIAAKPQLKALRERARVNHDAIKALDVAASDYGARIENLATDNGQLATEMTLLLAQMRRDIYSKLSPEQQQKLTEEADEMRQRRAGRRRGADKEKSL
jgi:Spy/CpxP family protein refolding chaperone